MDKLINKFNELSEKYKFTPEDIKSVQEIIFELESPDASQDADLEAEDFVAPVEDDGYVDGEAM